MKDREKEREREKGKRIERERERERELKGEDRGRKGGIPEIITQNYHLVCISTQKWVTYRDTGVSKKIGEKSLQGRITI